MSNTSQIDVYKVANRLLARHDGDVRVTDLPALVKFLDTCKAKRKETLEESLPLTVVVRRLALQYYCFSWDQKSAGKWLLSCWTSNGSSYAPQKGTQIYMDSIMTENMSTTKKEGQVVGSTTGGMLRVRFCRNDFHALGVRRESVISNVSRDRIFLSLHGNVDGRGDKRTHQFQRIVDYYMRVVDPKKTQSILEKEDEHIGIRKIREHALRWWRVRRIYIPTSTSFHDITSITGRK